MIADDNLPQEGENLAKYVRRIRKQIKKVPPQGAGYGNRLLANRWFPLQVYIFRPKGRGITPILD
jgi:hypothetical protein